MLFLLCFCGCDEGKRILELKDVQDFQVVENLGASELHISGLAFHSALAVEKITTEQDDQSLVVKVYLTHARNGLLGSFSHSVAIPAGVVRVVFGAELKEIWKRH